ncbi:MAG: pyrimidine-specific ribonucleoside hydrolase RihA [Hadesarchaea archaeon]|nr:MAG: pyrimidine-specific ribonucleoside hydrolase RihA [Hadesarchaea archaeon]
MEVKRVLLDMDPGIDDALALLLALRSPELEIGAITTVAGNVEVEKTTKNALKVLEFLGLETPPVAMGCSKPLFRELRTAKHVHGEDGLGGLFLPEPKLRPLTKHAVEVMVEEVERSGGRIVFVCTGPLTNLASALRDYPETMGKVEGVIVMGGAYGLTPYGHGNITPVAEYNFYVDPEAAEMVLDSGLPLLAVGLDVTMDPAAMLSKEEYEELRKGRTKEARLAAELLKPLLERFGKVALHDPMALVSLLKPELFKIGRYHVRVETKGELTRGQVVVDRRPFILPGEEWKGREIRICEGVDGEGFLRFFLERLME